MNIQREQIEQLGFSLPDHVTNYDRIISKTPEELAKIIGENVECFATCPARRYRCGYSDNCRIAWLDWLKREAPE